MLTGKMNMALTAIAATMSLWSPGARADLNLTGSFQGILPDNNRVELLAQPIAGRTGSYLGVLVMLDPKAVVYLMDPLDQNSYAMIPMRVTADGEIGITDDNPSLVLNISPAPGGSQQPSFTVVNANSGNSAGFQGPIRFEPGSRSNLSWIDAQPGIYKGSGNSEGTVEVSGMSEENQAMTAFALKDLNGGFLLRKKLGTASTGIYTLKAVSVKNTGPELSVQPQKIGFFVNRKGFFGTSTLFLLVNPQDDEDIVQLKLDR